MCDFHSILGIAIGNNYSIRHDASNSHSGMAGKLENKPNRKTVIFEVECSEEKLLATKDISTIASSIIRNFGECPEKLVCKIVNHYQQVKMALTDGVGLSPSGYFKDVEKYGDVYFHAINRGIICEIPKEVGGNLDLGSLTSIPEKLKLPDTVGGYLHLGSLTSIPEKLKLPDTVGGYLDLGRLDADGRARMIAKYGKSKLI